MRRTKRQLMAMPNSAGVYLPGPAQPDRFRCPNPARRLKIPSMPRSWQYPRWRRILLQATLCLILAAAIGVAALVSRQRIQSQYVDLSRRITIDSLAISLPANWIVFSDVDNMGVAAREPEDSDQQRSLAIRVQPVSPGLTAAEFLIRSGISQEAIDPGDLSDPTLPPQRRAFEPIEIAGVQGILMKVLRSDPSSPDSQEMAREELIAVAILPTHQGIVIRLSGAPDGDADNTALIRRFSRQIQSAGGTPPELKGLP